MGVINMPSLLTTSLMVTRSGGNNFGVFPRNFVISYTCVLRQNRIFLFLERKRRNFLNFSGHFNNPLLFRPLSLLLNLSSKTSLLSLFTPFFITLKFIIISHKGGTVMLLGTALAFKNPGCNHLR